MAQNLSPDCGYCACIPCVLMADERVPSQCVPTHEVLRMGIAVPIIAISLLKIFQRKEGFPGSESQGTQGKLAELGVFRESGPANQRRSRSKICVCSALWSSAACGWSRGLWVRCRLLNSLKALDATDRQYIRWVSMGPSPRLLISEKSSVHRLVLPQSFFRFR